MTNKNKSQREVINVKTRVTQDIARLNEVTGQLESIYSGDFMKAYREYCFNYSCLEAEHLDMPSPGNSIEERVAFNRLCRFRLEVLMDELLTFTLLGAELEGVPTESFAKECEPNYIFPEERRIKAQIKEHYNGKK